MPRIGVVNLKETPYRDSVRDPYLQSIRRAGGEPILLDWSCDIHSIWQVIQGLNGVLFTGGADFHPDLYGELPHPGLGEVCPLRDSFELLLLSATLQRRIPILAICRGCQLLAVASGGSLWQDLPAQRPQSCTHTPEGSGPAAFGQLLHTVTATPGSLAASVLGTEPLPVNSLHHQAVREVGGGFQISARAEDGLPEAVELPGYPFLLGVQWHPEHLSAQQPRQQALFNALLRACQN